MYSKMKMKNLLYSIILSESKQTCVCNNNIIVYNTNNSFFLSFCPIIIINFLFCFVCLFVLFVLSVLLWLVGWLL